MGFFNDMVGIAAKEVAISFRKSKAAEEVTNQRLRSDEETAKHNTAYKEIIESERKKYFSCKEHYIVSYMFAQVMLDKSARRDFTFLDQMPKGYRGGEEFQKNLKKVENEYYLELATLFKEGKISATSLIGSLKDLLYFEEIREEIQDIIEAEPFFENEIVAASSIFTDCEDIGSIINKIYNCNLLDATQAMHFFAKGNKAFKEGDFKSAVKYWLFGNYKKSDFDYIKISLLYFAQNENQDIAVVKLYDAYKNICQSIFGLSTVKCVDGVEKPILYPSVDMVIAEVMRHIRAGADDQYNDTLNEWLDSCGERVGYEQLNVLQNVFAYLNAFKQEMIVLEYMVRKNMARTSEQDKRLKFLKGRSSSENASTTIFNDLDAQEKENEILYDYRFVNWEVNEIQQYFNNLILENKQQKFRMVINEWNEDFEVQGISCHDENFIQLISNEVKRNFGEAYSISFVGSAVSVDEWADMIPSIYIRIKDSTAWNAEISFLITGEYVTNSIVHLAIMVLLSPVNHQNEVIKNEALCNKVIAIKEKYNPRINTYVSTMKNILITQIKSWVKHISND